MFAAVIDKNLETLLALLTFFTLFFFGDFSDGICLDNLIIAEIKDTNIITISSTFLYKLKDMTTTW